MMSVDLSDAHVVIDVFESAAQALRASPLRRGCAVHLPAAGRLLATGDLHDNPFHLKKILRMAKLDAGSDRHVVLHELIHGEKLLNGMDFSYRMLARVAELVVAYPLQVHPVLANHELAQLTGKGVSKGAGNNVVLFNDALEYAFRDDWEDVDAALKVFLRAMPLALLSEGGVCCAHSLPGAGAADGFDPDVLDRELTDEDYTGPHGAAYAMTWGRGCPDDLVERLAARWNVELFCLGHQHAETGVERVGARVVILNSDHENGRVLPLDLAALPTADESVVYTVPLGAVQE